MDKIVASLLAISIITLIISYKGPECIAGMKMKQEAIGYSIKKRQQQDSAKSSRSAAAAAAGAQGDEEAAPQGLAAVCAQAWRACYNVYLLVSHKRKDLLMLTMRLVVGWCWEVVFRQVFELIGEKEDGNAAVNTVLQCVLALVIVLTSLGIHMWIKDWDRPEAPGPAARATPDVAGQNAPPVSEVIVDSETRSPLSQA